MGEFLSVIAAVRCEPARDEVRRTGCVNIADASLVESPRDRRPAGRDYQIVRKRKTEKLIDGEWRRRRSRHEQCEGQPRAPVPHLERHRGYSGSEGGTRQMEGPSRHGMIS